MLSPAGEIDRKKLGDLVFADEDKRKQLNELTHSLILARMKELAAQAQRQDDCRGIVYDVPLLFESGADKLCDTTIAVIAPRQVRLARLLARDGADLARIEARLAAQPENDYYTRHAAHTIVNADDLTSLREKTRRLIGQILCEYGECAST